MTAPRSVTIVGGGVAGLAAGVLLARRGVRVRLLEAREVVGGCCSSTAVDGYTFHDGALYVAVPVLLDAAFARLGLSRPELVPLRPARAGYVATLDDGTRVSIAARRLRVVDPRGRERVLDAEVERFLARWRPTLGAFSDLMLQPFSPARLLRRGWRHAWKLRGSLADELRRAWHDEAARAALGGFMLYTGRPASELPAVAVLALASMLDDGFFLPAGGMGAIPRALERALRAAGGEIHLRAAVRRIEVRGGRVAGVDVPGLGFVESGLVLSSTSGMATVRLLGDEHAPRALRRRAARAPLSHTAVSVQLGLSNPLDVEGHGNALLPPLAEHARVFDPSEAHRWINWSVPTVTVPELAPAGGSVVEMFCPRPAGAAAEADEVLADRVIEALSRRRPLDVAVRRVRGPAHFRDAMNLHAGALYGLSPAASPAAQFPARTALPGLFLAGQTTYPGSGVNPAMISGVLAAEAVLQSCR